MPYARLNTATPDQGSAAGSAMTPSRSVWIRSQSSIRPIMIVTTGPIDAVDPPAASRRAIPRSIASAAAIAWATEKQTVVLTLIPRALASSIATRPAVVAGNFTMMFGARRSKWRPCSTIRSADRNRVGSVWVERRPWRPPCASKAGSRSGAARVDISSTIAQARSASLATGRSTVSSRTRPRQWAGSFRQTSVTIVGLAVAPTAPNEIAYSSSSIAQESFQMSVAVSAIVRPSGVSTSAGAGISARLTDRTGRSGRDALERHRDGPATAEAQGCQTVPAFSPSELVEQRRDDPRARGPDRVSESDRAAVHVHLVPVEPQLATVGQRLGGERLVDLDQVERVDRQLDPVEQPADSLDRCKEEPFRLHLRLRVSDDPGERRQPVALDRPLADDDGRGGSVRDARGVARGHAADRRAAAIVAGGQLEGRRQPRKRFGRRVPARAFVGLDDRLAALRVPDRDRHELIREGSRVDRGDRALVGAQREGVLVLPRDRVVDRDALGMRSHVAVLERAPQPVLNRRVDERAVPQAIAEARPRQQVGGEIHALHPARHDHLGVARPDLRGAEHDRLQPRPADAIDRRRGRRVRESARERGLARRRLAGARLQHLAHQDLVDRRAVTQPGTLQGCPDRDAAQLRGSRGRQRAAELADRRPGGARDEHL